MSRESLEDLYNEFESDILTFISFKKQFITKLILNKIDFSLHTFKAKVMEQTLGIVLLEYLKLICLNDYLTDSPIEEAYQTIYITEGLQLFKLIS